MWTVSGPFDEDGTGEINFQKRKLLKTGTAYSLGRKSCSLLIPNKKISAHHGDLVVGHFAVDDVDIPNSRPSIEYVNPRNKGIRITREKDDILVNPQATQELKDGDILSLVTNVFIKIQWEEVCCLVEPIRGKSPISLDGCAILGIHLAHVPRRQVTHHIISTYSPTSIIAASLLSACHFVKLEWVKELIRLGNLPKSNDSAGSLSLEQNFSLPLISKYRPGYSVSLPLSQKEFRVWEPNESRSSMFSDYRFLCVDERGRELGGDFRELIERGNGSFEMFDPTLGRERFHGKLERSRAKEGKTLVLIGKQKSILAAVGKDQWNSLSDEANEFGLSFIEPDVVVQVVIEMDVSLLALGSSEAMRREDDPNLNAILNTHSNEPTFPPPESEKQHSVSSERLVKRVKSRPPSQELAKCSSVEYQHPIARSPLFPRQLTRRLNKGVPIITGLDDPSLILDSIPAPQPRSTPPPLLDLTASTPARPTTLKRRVARCVPGGAVATPFSLPLDEVTEEPPLKRLRTLFDASVQEYFDGAAFENLQSGTYTQIHNDTQNKTDIFPMGSLAEDLTLPEEEAAGTHSAGAQPRRAKRSIDEVDDSGSGNFGSETLSAESGQSLQKKRAVETVNSVKKSIEVVTGTVTTGTTSIEKPVINSNNCKSGVRPGELDQDHAFLKAIVSTKKGKKIEDEFDREFNNLKISKPALERDEEEWAVLAQFGDETNLRGNFMVIVEMPAYNRNRSRRECDTDWRGRMDFKKFKKKSVSTHGEKVQLFLSHSGNCGLGADDWDDDIDISTSEMDFIPVSQPSRRDREAAEPQKKNFEVPITLKLTHKQGLPENPPEASLPRTDTNTVPSKARIVAPPPPPSRNTRQQRTLHETQPLFLSSDGEGEFDQITLTPRLDEERITDDFDESETLPSTGTSTRSKSVVKNILSRSQPARRKGAKAMLVADDDGDDLFTGFAG